jgi:hypothetical protein
MLWGALCDASFNESMADTPQDFMHGESLSGANRGMGRNDHFIKLPCLVAGSRGRRALCARTCGISCPRVARQAPAT